MSYSTGLLDVLYHQINVFFLTTVIAVLLVLLLLWYKVAYYPYNVFYKVGIPGPPPRAFFGNVLELQRKGIFETYTEWHKLYGDVIGFYIGSSPTLLVTDLEVIKLIMVKEFDTFSDRRSPGLEVARGVQCNLPPNLFDMRTAHWRETRRLINNCFHGKKLKMMTPLFKESVTSVITKLKDIADTGNSIDVAKLFSHLTMETILAAGLSYKVDILKGHGDQLAETADGVFEVSRQGALIFSAFISHFPFLIPLVRWGASKTPAAHKFGALATALRHLIKERCQQLSPPQKNKDYLQILIDASRNDLNESINSHQTCLNNDTKKELNINSMSTTFKSILTNDEVVNLSVMLFLAGYETTSSLLTLTAYMLALNTDKQDRLCQAIDDYYLENKQASLDEASQSIEYLDWCLQESLRMFSPIACPMRYCQHTTTLNGYTIPEGVNVLVPLKILHHDSRWWSEPLSFIPERFAPEERDSRHPMCHLPFGIGPRSCLGGKFAFMEAKMTMISILKQYQFVQTKDTQVPMETKLGVTLAPAGEVNLLLQSRKV